MHVLEPLAGRRAGGGRGRPLIVRDCGKLPSDFSHSMSALEGVKVLDLTRLLPGLFATMLLADLGADVLKVEDTGMGDYVRWAPPYHEGAAESAKSAQFLALNRGKRSVRLDLKQDVVR